MYVQSLRGPGQCQISGIHPGELLPSDKLFVINNRGQSFPLLSGNLEPLEPCRLGGELCRNG